MTRRLSPRSVGRSALGPSLFLPKIPFPLLGLGLFSPSVRKHCDSPPSLPGSCGWGPGVPPPRPQSSHLYSEVSARVPHLLLPLPSGSELFSRSRGPGWGQRPGWLGCGPGFGALAEPAHLAATRVPAAGDRPAGRRGRQMGSEAASPMGPSALRPGRVHQRRRSSSRPLPRVGPDEPSLGNP